MNKIASFAKALYSLADEKKIIKIIFDQIESFLSLLHTHPEIIKLFDNQSLNKLDKFNIIDKTFKNHFNDLLCNFMRVLIDMHSFYDIKLIFKKYLEIVEEKESSQFIKIISAFALEDKQIEQIKCILEQKTKKNLIIKVEIDPNVIAGIKIESESNSIDYTIKGKLKAIAASLHSTRFIR
ncbi:ATP synthase F1 subunit delta [Mycoplasmoides alvi]|uniref:ATP synthase F1 subunit delta n=1 Tax=Mycoplasmoides alvi TaxID=78580 RepID=UPI00051C2F9C|nr:ATP synthase F1 subunit delta [Mycoplasmoides alvi]